MIFSLTSFTGVKESTELTDADSKVLTAVKIETKVAGKGRKIKKRKAPSNADIEEEIYTFPQSTSASTVPIQSVRRRTSSVLPRVIIEKPTKRNDIDDDSVESQKFEGLHDSSNEQLVPDYAQPIEQPTLHKESMNTTDKQIKQVNKSQDIKECQYICNHE